MNCPDVADWSARRNDVTRGVATHPVTSDRRGREEGTRRRREGRRHAGKYLHSRSSGRRRSSSSSRLIQSVCWTHRRSIGERRSGSSGAECGLPGSPVDTAASIRRPTNCQHADLVLSALSPVKFIHEINLSFIDRFIHKKLQITDCACQAPPRPVNNDL